MFDVAVTRHYAPPLLGFDDSFLVIDSAAFMAASKVPSDLPPELIAFKSYPVKPGLQTAIVLESIEFVDRLAGSKVTILQSVITIPTTIIPTFTIGKWFKFQQLSVTLTISKSPALGLTFDCELTLPKNAPLLLTAGAKVTLGDVRSVPIAGACNNSISFLTPPHLLSF